MRRLTGWPYRPYQWLGVLVSNITHIYEKHKIKSAGRECAIALAKAFHRAGHTNAHYKVTIGLTIGLIH